MIVSEYLDATYRKIKTARKKHYHQFAVGDVFRFLDEKCIGQVYFRGASLTDEFVVVDLSERSVLISKLKNQKVDEKAYTYYLTYLEIQFRTIEKLDYRLNLVCKIKWEKEKVKWYKNSVPLDKRIAIHKDWAKKRD